MTTRVEDWVFHDTIAVEVNGASMTPIQAAELLASRRTGHVDVIATGEGARREFEFEFVLAEEADLEGVDGALEHLIAGRVLDRDAIASFITRSRPYATASRYLDGLSNYLYGVLAREDLSDRGGEAEAYERRYDISVRILGTYDRRPAEAICGLVAFHYNHFNHAVAKTKSWWVSDVSKRFLGLLEKVPIERSDLSDRAHSTLDAALSDTTTQRLLAVGSVALDGSYAAVLDEVLADVAAHRPSDQLKIRMIAAECALAGGRLEQARAQADELRQSVVAEGWYAEFRARCEVRP
ncbi:MAG: hypothetical protein ABIR17_11955 [Pseudolysinimonas sp.]|uniref:hypothetical protein n=1 Tax=Pseudolysinimonas sp. TaxID=2680009 RepID=UPI0032652762